MSVRESLERVKKSIGEVARDSGRDPASVRLVLVTKTVSPERIREAYDAGERDFGENRVQEWQGKKDVLPQDIRWHLIGHLQTNKVKYVVGKVALIHSLDRLDLAEAIERQAMAKGVPEVPCLVQVNISGEESKSGLEPSRVEELVSRLAAFPSIQLRGMMAIGPLTEDETRVRDCFRKIRELRDALKEKFPQHSWDVLSMGMSSDYRIAIEEGANMLRIGSLIFPREPLT